MNKKDLIPVFVIILMMFAYMVIAPKLSPKTDPGATQQDGAATTNGTDQVTLSSATNRVDNPVSVPDLERVTESETEQPPVDEQVITIQNDVLRLEITSIGGGIKSATMIATEKNGTSRYPEFNEETSDPVALYFTNAPALSYEGMPGLGSNAAFQLEAGADGTSAILKKQLDNMLFERILTLGDGYLLNVTDRFSALESQPVLLPAMRILTGHMQNPPDMKSMKGVSILGVDSFSKNGEISYWGKNKGFKGSPIQRLFKDQNKPPMIDEVPEGMANTEVTWVAAKNKFFTQIIQSPADTAATMALMARRNTEQPKAIELTDVMAALSFDPVTLGAGQEQTLDYNFYVGPKSYSILKAAGNNMEGVMEFKTVGFWSFMNWMMEPARKALLWTLNLFHGIFHNYGVAIILLTLLVRILFWPLTHKSTESMKRMQEIQPQVKELQAKHKKDPQRLQQETMKLYRENKVNPMGGCLPMIVQIPVFIALFTVLRNAIELRYAGFLWISDLSTPENLLMGKVPVVGALNILPIVMAVSMIFQQKMNAPSAAATPEQQQQQKMMMFMMPIMMLFFFYTMPSGLVLYWTTSNLLMIAQTAIRNMRKKMKEA